jgi:hypothetical protein
MDLGYSEAAFDLLKTDQVENQGEDRQFVRVTEKDRTSE